MRMDKKSTYSSTQDHLCPPMNRLKQTNPAKVNREFSLTSMEFWFTYSIIMYIFERPRFSQLKYVKWNFIPSKRRESVVAFVVWFFTSNCMLTKHFIQIQLSNWSGFINRLLIKLLETLNDYLLSFPIDESSNIRHELLDLTTKLMSGIASPKVQCQSKALMSSLFASKNDFFDWKVRFIFHVRLLNSIRGLDFLSSWWKG